MQKTHTAVAAALALGVFAYATSAGAIIRPSLTDAETCTHPEDLPDGDQSRT